MKRGCITENQSFAVNLLVRALKVERSNCCWDDFQKTLDRMPKGLKAIHGLINDELSQYSQTDEFKKAERCRFKAGDTVVKYEPYLCEIDPVYCDRILNRWEHFAKDDAKLTARGTDKPRKRRSAR